MGDISVMKKILILSILVITSIGLTACGNSSSSTNRQKKENSSLRAANSSLKKSANKKQNNSSHQSNNSNSSQDQSNNSTAQATTGSSSSNVINSPQDAENLIEHSMHSEPGTYKATPAKNGYIVSGVLDGTGSAYVHYDGSIIWDNGTYESYGDASAPTSN